MKRILLIIFLLSSFYAFPQGGSIPRSELVTASGTNTYAATIASIASLANGLTIKVKFTNGNTGASTFTLTGSAGSMGSAALTKNDDTALSAGDISAGGWYWIVYNNSVGHWQISGGGSALTDGSGTTANGTAVDLGGTLTSSADIQLGDNRLDITGNNGDGGGGTFFIGMGSGSEFSLGTVTGGDTHKILFAPGGGNINISSNGAGFQGLVYSNDFSGNYTNRSLVDKEYVDGKVSNNITDGVTTIAPAQDAVFDALALKAPLASPAFTGTPTAPTQTAGDNSTKIATTEYVDDAVSSAGGLPALGTSLQQLRVNSGATDLEYFSPLSSPSTTDYDIIRWNAGTSQYNRLGLGTDGYYLGAVSGTLAYSDPTSRFWNLSGTSTFTGNSTISTGTNSLGFTTTRGFATATTVLENFTNNGSQIYQLTANGAPKYEFFNTSGVKVGAATLTSLSAVSGLRMFNGGETAFYDFGYLGSNSSMYLLFNTAASTKFRIGSNAAGSATLQVTGRGTTTGEAFRVEDSGNNAVISMVDQGNAIFQQRPQSSTNTFFTLTQAAHTGGTPTGLNWTGGANTAMTNGASVNDWNINLGRTIQWAGNNTVSTYKGINLSAPTLAFASVGGTVTTASTLAISGPPVAGTNASITNALALNIESGNLSLSTAGGKIIIKSGSNASAGTAVLSGGTATVNTTAVTANSVIILTSQVDGGTPGFLRITAKTAATSFVITSDSGSDTSTVGWWILDAN